MNKGQYLSKYCLTERAHADNTHLRPPPPNRQSTLTDANDWLITRETECFLICLKNANEQKYFSFIAA